MKIIIILAIIGFIAVFGLPALFGLVSSLLPIALIVGGIILIIALISYFWGSCSGATFDVESVTILLKTTPYCLS